MQRYFVSNASYNLSDKQVERFILDSDDSHHILNVMRMTIGDKIEIVFDNKLFLTRIVNIDKLVTTEVIDTINTLDKDICKITIAQSLVKEQKMDYILQKATELGVSEIVPINTSRSIIKIDKLKENKRVERWQKIVKESSEQSKRISIPIIKGITDIDKLTLDDFTYKILLSVNETSTSVKRVLSNVKLDDKILIVIGPEGGFTNLEESSLIEQGFITASLGSRVLRTETASVMILSIINYLFMR